MSKSPKKSAAQWIRAAISVTVLVATVLLIGIGGYLYLTHSELPQWVIRPIASLIENRSGARIDFDSVRIGPVTGLFHPGIEITGADLEFGDSADPTRFRLGRLQWTRAEGTIEGLKVEIPDAEGPTVAELSEVKFGGGEIDAHRLRVGGSPSSGLAIDSVHIAPHSSGVTIRGLSQTPESEASGTRIAVSEINMSPLRSEGEPANLVIDEVAVRQVDFHAPVQEEAPPLCERLAGIFGPLKVVRDGIQNGQGRIAAGLASLLRWLRIILIAAMIGFFLLKLAPAWEARKWWSRLALAAAPVVLPCLIYFLGRDRAWSLPLFSIGLACAAVMTVALYFGAYRHFSAWYHKGAAVVLDLAGIVILPLFLAHGFVGAFSIPYPAGLMVNRTTINGISGELDTAACEGVNTVRIRSARAEAASLNTSFTEFLAGRPALSITSIVFGGASSAREPLAKIENPAGRELLELPELSATISNLSAGIDLDQRRFENIGARLRVSGIAQSASLRESVQRVRFLRGRAAEFSTAKFAVSANALGPRSDPPAQPIPTGVATDGANISVDAALGLDLAACALPVDAGVGIDTRDLKATASVARRGEIIQVRDLRTTAGSRLKFRDGTATAAFGDRLSVNAGVRDAGVQTEASTIDVSNAKINVTAPIGCAPSGSQSIKAFLDQIGVTAESGLEAGVEQAVFSIDRQIGRSTAKLNSTAELHGVSLSAASTAEGAEPPPQAWLNADFPFARFDLAGTSSGEVLPRRIDGTLDALVSRSASQPRQPENLAFGMDAPLRFSANLREPEFDIPPQQGTFRQTIDSRLPESAPLDFSFHATAGNGAAPARLQASLLSDWISFTVPNLPRQFEPSEISKLILTTRGTLDRLPLEQDLFRPDELPPLCRESVGLELNPLRVEASLNPEAPGPLVRIFGKTGPEIRIQLSQDGSTTEIGDSGLAFRTGRIERQLRRLSAPNARVEALDLHLRVNGIQPNEAAGASPLLSLEAEMARTNDSFTLSSRLAPGDAQPLLGLTFERAGDRIEFALNEELEVHKLTSALEPFLQPLQCEFGWITPDIRIQKFSGNALLAGSELVDANLKATLAPGSRLAADFGAAPTAKNGKPPAHLRKIQFAVERDSPLTVTACLAKSADTEGDLDLKLDANLPLKIDADGPNGEHHEATIELRTAAAGALHSQPPATNPVIERGRKVFGDLRRHFASASRAFGPEQSADVSQALDLNWDLALRDSTAAKPFEIRKGRTGAESDELRSALSIDRADISWKRAGEPEDNHFKTSGNIAAASKLHQDYLVVEADSALDLNFALASQPGCSFDFRTPLAAAFREELEPSSGGGSLFDAAAYESLWAGYQPAFPARSAGPIVNCRNLTTGGLSIRQAALPVTAPRIAVGHGDHLQLNFPFAGSLLFGTAGGLLQADIEWIEDHANVSGAGNLELSDFQAAALGRPAAQGHLPFVEDELNARINFLARGFPIGRDGIQTPPAGPLARSELPPFDLDLSLTRAHPGGTLPGILQATSRMNIKLMNEFLDKALAGVRLAEPPTALRYQGLDLNLAVKDGIIQTDPLFLNLSGVRLYASDAVEVESQIRVHWKRENWGGPPYRFTDFLSSMRRFTAGAPGE